jgi:hypothetical protein
MIIYQPVFGGFEIPGAEYTTFSMLSALAVIEAPLQLGWHEKRRELFMEFHA